MLHVTEGRGGRVDEQKLAEDLMARRGAAKRIAARQAAEAAAR